MLRDVILVTRRTQSFIQIVFTEYQQSWKVQNNLEVKCRTERKKSKGLRILSANPKAFESLLPTSLIQEFQEFKNLERFRVSASRPILINFQQSWHSRDLRFQKIYACCAVYLPVGGLCYLFMSTSNSQNKIKNPLTLDHRRSSIVINMKIRSPKALDISLQLHQNVSLYFLIASSLI